jgi:hypothetical protein
MNTYKRTKIAAAFGALVAVAWLVWPIQFGDQANAAASARTGQRVVALGDFPTGGSIGTASATVERADVITITQTTAAQTLTIPASTNPNYKTLVIVNRGTTSFTVLSNVVAVAGSLVLTSTGAGLGFTAPASGGGGASFPAAAPTGNAVGDLIISTSKRTDYNLNGFSMVLANGGTKLRSAHPALLSTFPSFQAWTTAASGFYTRISRADTLKLSSGWTLESAGAGLGVAGGLINDTSITIPPVDSAPAVCTMTGISVAAPIPIFTFNRLQWETPCSAQASMISNYVLPTNGYTTNTVAGKLPANTWPYSAIMHEAVGDWAVATSVNISQGGLVGVTGNTPDTTRAIGRATGGTLGIYVPPGYTDRTTLRALQTIGQVDLNSVNNMVPTGVTPGFAASFMSCASVGFCPFQPVRSGAGADGGVIPAGSYTTPLPLADQWTPPATTAQAAAVKGAITVTTNFITTAATVGTTGQFQSGGLIDINGNRYVIDSVRSASSAAGSNLVIALQNPGLRQNVAIGDAITPVANSQFADVGAPVTVTSGVGTTALVLSSTAAAARIGVNDWIGCIEGATGTFTFARVTAVVGSTLGMAQVPTSCIANGNNVKKIPFMRTTGAGPLTPTSLAPQSPGPLVVGSSGMTILIDQLPTTGATTIPIGAAWSAAWMTQGIIPGQGTPRNTSPITMFMRGSVNTLGNTPTVTGGPFTFQSFPYGNGDGSTTFTMPNLTDSNMVFGGAANVVVGSATPTLITGGSITPKVIGWPFIITATP